MANTETFVKVCNTHVEAQGVIERLQKAGFDLKKLSIVGKFMVTAHGAGEVAKAREILGLADDESTPSTRGVESGSAPIREDDA